ncbi:hypothetical protein PIB30_094777 [Stylosanthes scabra]|uniref:Uncharacterized protein n=1 Tax=Stylosanthes scabra TaxID=79078 RepID=A0ABU6YUB7_9FABA|nr:hypothetical protein [Stylosanthes scabra]
MDPFIHFLTHKSRHVGIDSGNPRIDSHASLKFISKAGVDSGHSESTPCNVLKQKSSLGLTPNASKLVVVPNNALRVDSVQCRVNSSRPTIDLASPLRRSLNPQLSHPSTLPPRASHITVLPLPIAAFHSHVAASSLALPSLSLIRRRAALLNHAALIEIRSFSHFPPRSTSVLASPLNPAPLHHCRALLFGVSCSALAAATSTNDYYLDDDEEDQKALRS